VCKLRFRRAAATRLLYIPRATTTDELHALGNNVHTCGLEHPNTSTADDRSERTSNNLFIWLRIKRFEPSALDAAFRLTRGMAHPE